jgi:hypothetical protein
MADRPKHPSPTDLVQHEFAQERAATLGRLGRALEAALAALIELDNAPAAAEATVDQRRQRSALIEQASVALWHFVVQREACGLHDMRHVLHDYRVPAEVAARMGILPATPPRPGGRRRVPQAVG